MLSSIASPGPFWSLIYPLKTILDIVSYQSDLDYSSRSLSVLKNINSYEKEEFHVQTCQDNAVKGTALPWALLNLHIST